MAPRTFASRLEKLQQALAAQLSKPIASCFLPFSPDHAVEDYDRMAKEERDRMVADGEIGRSQRSRVLFVRWMTQSEHAERKQLESTDLCRNDPWTLRRLLRR